MEQDATKYEPTPSELKLLEIVINPDNRHKKVTEICSMAEIDRKTYYRAYEKPGFIDLVKKTSKDLTIQAVIPVIHSFVKEATRGSFPHGKVILEMADVYTEKQKIDLTGIVNFSGDGDLADS